MKMALHPTVRANGLHAFDKLLIAGKQGASISVASKGFGREKARAPDSRNTATSLSLLARPEALGGVFNDRDPMRARDLVDSFVIRHLPEQVHGDNRLGAWRNRGFQFGGIEVVGLGVDVHKH